MINISSIGKTRPRKVCFSVVVVVVTMMMTGMFRERVEHRTKDEVREKISFVFVEVKKTKEEDRSTYSME